jgi:phosphatidylinositol alpha-1,6-mannosyltransferase
MKKTFIISSEFPPLPGGIGNHAYLLANYLHKKGYEISVLTDFRSAQKDNLFDQKQKIFIYRAKIVFIKEIVFKCLKCINSNF